MNEDEMSALQRTVIATILVFLVIGLFSFLADGVQAQDIQTCVNNQGEVVLIKFPYNCPPGFWLDY